MSASQRSHTVSVIQRLLDQPQRFSFFQAVRLLEKWLTANAAFEPGPGPDATKGARLADQIRFRNSLSLSFPASEIESLIVHRRAAPATQSLEDDGDPTEATLPPIERIELTPAFMGMLGVSGTLPLHYTELIAQRELYDRDTAARAFLDVFTHRAVALFFAAWQKNRLYIQYERDQKNAYLPLVLSLVGIGQTGLYRRLKEHLGGVPDEAVAYFGGMVQQRPVSAVQLRNLLRGYLGVPIEIEQFVGRWYALPTEATTSLGWTNGVLGLNAIAGERVWQRDLCVRIIVGPLDREHYLRFLPGGAGAQAITQWLHLLCGVSFEYEVRLRLKKEAVMGVELDSTSSFGRLGWDTFLCTEPATEDREDVVYDIHVAAAV